MLRAMRGMACGRGESKDLSSRAKESAAADDEGEGPCGCFCRSMPSKQNQPQDSEIRTNLKSNSNHKVLRHSPQHDKAFDKVTPFAVDDNRSK